MGQSTDKGTKTPPRILCPIIRNYRGKESHRDYLSTRWFRPLTRAQVKHDENTKLPLIRVLVYYQAPTTTTAYKYSLNFAPECSQFAGKFYSTSQTGDHEMISAQLFRILSLNAKFMRRKIDVFT